jgi:hypothetical protein
MNGVLYPLKRLKLIGQVSNELADAKAKAGVRLEVYGQSLSFLLPRAGSRVK